MTNIRPANISGVGLTPGQQIIQGPQGVQGPVGPRGADGVGAPYVHDQAVPADVWVITHNRGAIPTAVRVIDTAGTEVHGRVENPTLNQTILRFSAPFGGKASLL